MKWNIFEVIYKCRKKQDIYSFEIKNQDLDSNLYNLKKTRLANKYYETDPNPSRPYS
jgi:hypothetical protein